MQYAVECLFEVYGIAEDFLAVLCHVLCFFKYLSHCD